MSHSTVVYPPVLAAFFELFEESSISERNNLRPQFELYLASTVVERESLLREHPLLKSLIEGIREVRVHEDIWVNAIHPFIDDISERCGIQLSRDRIFELIYIHSLWGPGETPSGQGAWIEATRSLRESLPKLLKKYDIRSMVDAACGNFHWMKEMDVSSLLESYCGIDIVPTMIADNQLRYSRPNVQFSAMDLAISKPPKADLIFCRHLLHHLTLEDCSAVLKNFRESGSQYLLTTQVPDIEINEEVFVTGAWRMLNLELPPFNLGPRLDAISDQQQPGDSTLLALYSLC